VTGLLLWVGASLLSLLLSGEAASGIGELRKLPLLSALALPAGIGGGEEGRRRAALLLLLSAGVAALFGIVEQIQGAGGHPTRLDGPIGFYMTTAGIFLLVSLLSLSFVMRRKLLGGLVPPLFLLVTAGLLLTYTRGAWVAWAAGAGILILRRRKSGLLGLLLFVAAILLHPGLRERLFSMGDLSLPFNRQRLLIWREGVRLFLEHPLFGVGLHDLAGLLEEAGVPAGDAPPTHFHSTYLQTAVATGAAGLAGLLLFLAGLARELLRAARRASRPFDRVIAEGALAAFAGFTVHGLFEWNIGDSEVVTAFCMITGLGLAVGNQMMSKRTPAVISGSCSPATTARRSASSSANRSASR